MSVYNVWTFIKNCIYMKIQFNSASKVPHNHTFASKEIKHRHFANEELEAKIRLFGIKEARADALRRMAEAGYLEKAISAVVRLQNKTPEELRQQDIPQQYWTESYNLLTNFGGS